MRRTAIFAVALAALLALAECSRVGMVEDCKQELDRALQISGCTAVIDSGQASGRGLAVVYSIRRAAYINLRDPARVIEDFDQALPYILTVVLLAGFIGTAVPPKAGGQPYVKER
jgi:uncharacterized membrane protein YraQ (UPF0718 family)